MQCIQCGKIDGDNFHCDECLAPAAEEIDRLRAENAELEAENARIKRLYMNAYPGRAQEVKDAKLGANLRKLHAESGLGTWRISTIDGGRSPRWFALNNLDADVAKAAEGIDAE